MLQMSKLTCTEPSSNRTFMELKWRVRGRYVDDFGRF